MFYLLSYVRRKAFMPSTCHEKWVLTLRIVLKITHFRYCCTHYFSVPLHRNQKLTHMDTQIPSDMKVLMNHIYEFKKGIRKMVLYTFNQRYEQFATTRLQHQGIDYMIQPVGNGRLNLYFGQPECLSAIRMLIDKPLEKLSPEQDFILGALLGYDLNQECKRYCVRKQRTTN